MLALLIAVAASSLARGEELADDDVELLEMERSGVPVVQLYTMGQGEVLFQKFGHAAMCLHYPARNRQDICFNYGTTDFDSPIPLTWSFLRGEANFWVSITTPRRMLAFYRRLDRDIYRQDIALSSERAHAVEAKLLHDARAENRYYQYHHFYDNCTTRVRDIIDDATDGALRRDADHSVGRSFRSFGRQGFAEQKWLIIMSDFIMGREGDSEATQYQAMFLPDVLRVQVASRLGVTPVVVETRHGRAFSQDAGTGRGWILLIGALLALPLAITQALRRYQRVGIAFVAVPLAMLGALIWLLAMVSTLSELRWNEAVFVFVPFDIALVVLAQERRTRYARVRVALLALVSLLLAVGAFRQPLWIPILVAFVPLMILARPHEVVARRDNPPVDVESIE